MCHYLMCLSWVWCAPYVTFVSNNVIRTIIIKHDIHFILSNIAIRSKCNFKNVPMIGLVVIPTSRDEVQYCGWKSQENSLYSPQHCPSMASFPPMEVRQWAGNLLACRQASKWPRRDKVWIFENIITSPAVKYVKKKNGIKMALWIFNLSWMNVFTCYILHFYTHFLCWLYLIHTDCQPIPRK